MSTMHKMTRRMTAFAATILMGVSLMSSTAEAKTQRTYYTEAAIERARQLTATADWAKAKRDDAVKRAAWMLGMSDEDLWNYVPPASQLRALEVAFNVGCPVHGAEVYKKGGHYPWIMSRELPFKMKCPIGGEVYPSNDFVPWDNGGQKIDTKKPYQDDGTGYVDATGQHYYFVGCYVFWQRWHDDIIGGFSNDDHKSGLRALRDAYLLTGDARYAHKAAILLARIAQQYPDMDFIPQGSELKHPAEISGKTFDNIWENFVVNAFATTYDAIYPEIEKDGALQQFLHGKGIDDPRPLIEKNLLWEAMDAITGGRDGKHPIQIVGNFGMRQQSITELAVVLDNDDPAKGMTKKEVVDWVMTGAGGVEDALWNLVYRDGHVGESSPSYMVVWQRSLLETAKNLRKLGYDFFKHPKMWKLVNVGLDLAVLGEHAPSIGDSGGFTGNGRVGWVPEVLLETFLSSGDPRVAKALEMVGGNTDSLWDEYPAEQIRQAAARFDAATGGQWPRHTRHLGGFGVAIAESPREDVGLSLYYGYAGGGHGHRDRLTIEMFAFGRPILTENGYPSPMGSIDITPKRFFWGGNTISHYDVIIDRRWQEAVNRGRVKALVGTPQLQIIDVDAAKGAYPDQASLYRRTSLLIENPDGLPYLLDLFRVQGGHEHVWSYHGPVYSEYKPYGLQPGAQQEKGTLAGPNVPFGSLPGKVDTEGSRGYYNVKPLTYGADTGAPPSVVPTDVTSGFQYLFNIRRAPAPQKSWGAVWSDPATNRNLRLTVPAGELGEVVLADSEPNDYPSNPKTLPYLLAFHDSKGTGGNSAGGNSAGGNGAGGNGTGAKGADGKGATPLRSSFVAVSEPYRQTNDVTDVTRLATKGSPQAVAVQIERHSGHDTVLSTLDAKNLCRATTAAGAFELQGSLAMTSTQGQGQNESLRTATVIDAHRFQSPWLSVAMPELLEGKIKAVDYEKNTITLDRRLEGATGLIGQVALLRNKLNDTSYEIKAVSEAADGKTVLHFGDTPMVVGTGAVSALNAESGRIDTSTTFDVWEVDGAAHAGRRLVSADKKSNFLIRAFDRAGKRFQVDGTTSQLNAAFAPHEKPARYWIADTGPGDDWTIAATCQVERDAPTASWRVRLNAPVELGLRLQPGRKLQLKNSTKPLPQRVRDGFTCISISPAMTKDGLIELTSR